MRKLALGFLLTAALGATGTFDCLAASSWRDVFERGQTDLGLQELAKAESDFREALSLVELQSKNPDDIASCINRLADTLALREKTAEAKALYSRALLLLENKYGSGSVKIAPALISLGSILESEGNSQAAMAYYQRAFNLNERNYGPYSPQMVMPLHKLARATARAGHKQDAKKHYKVALNALLQKPDLAASREMQSLLNDYGDLSNEQDHSNQELLQDFKNDLLSKQNNPDPVSSVVSGSNWQQQTQLNAGIAKDAETTEAPGVVSRQVSGLSLDETMAPAFSTMSSVIFDQGHYDQSQDFYERKVAIDIKALGNDHPSVANDLNALAMNYIAGQKYSQADVLLTRALAIYKKVYGPSNILTIRTQATLAGVKLHLRQFEPAAQLYRNTLNYALATLGPNHLESARILNNMAYLYYNQNRLSDALTYYQWALSSTQAAVGQKDPLYGACLKDYARVLRSMGRTSEALAAESKSDSILSSN